MMLGTTWKHMMLGAGLIVTTALPVMAQSTWTAVSPKRTDDYDERRDQGYCVVRVKVDNVVIVHIRGNRIGFETVAGRQAFDQGTECSQPMPAGGALADFRFKGVDGRGRVELMEQPSSGNQYTAKVRIEDPKSGDEGYTFKVEWRNTNPSSNYWDNNSGNWGPSGGGWNSGSGWGNGNNNSGWGNNSGSGWGNSNSGSGWGNNSGSGWGNSNNNGSWGSGDWWSSDFRTSAPGNGVGRMNGQPDLQLTGANVEFKSDGTLTIQFTSNGPAVQFAGQWRRTGNSAAEITLNNGFNGDGANGTGTISFRNRAIDRIDLNGRNSRSGATFTMQFTAGGGMRPRMR